MKSTDLTQGKVASSLLRFAVPFLISSFLQALYGAADLMVVGQFANSAAVSAVGIGSQVMQMITGIVLGISMGGTVLIARSVGEKSKDNTASAIGNLASLFCIFAVVLTPIMLLCTSGSVSLMNTPAAAVEYTKQYIFICACGIPFIIGYNAVSCIFRGLGDSRTPVLFVAIACVINIVVDLILVGVFHMGASGAAIATVTSQAISFFSALLYMRKKGFDFYIGQQHFKLKKHFCKFILKVGSPLSLQDALVCMSFLIITAIINSMGVVASASVGVVEKIIIFAMLPPSAFSSAVSAITAQNIGAKKPKRALQTLQYGIGFSLIFGVSVCIFSQIFPQSLTSLFSNDPQVIEASAMYLRAYSIDCILVSFVFCMNAYFSGCGKSVISLVHSLIATFCVRIPVSYILSTLPGVTLYDIGLAAPSATMISIIICFAYFYYQKKRAAPIL